MGTCGYYRRCVKDFSLIATPLYGLIKKGVDFVWTRKCQEAFEELKQKLISGPILALPVNEGTYILDTDASDVGLGAVLCQQQAHEERVIANASRTMRKTEQIYETTRKELLAVVNELKQLRQYLLGRHFVIRTDHAALSWLHRTAEPMPQLARWLTFIEQFDYEVIHREGKRHGNADGLSRRPPPNKDKSSEMLPLHWIKKNGMPDESITSASAISTRPSSEDEVEEQSVNTERAENGIVRVVRGNKGGIDLLVGESLLKRQQDDPMLEALNNNNNNNNSQTISNAL